MSEAKILEHDPLTDAETILRDDFYGKSKATPASPLTVAPSQEQTLSEKADTWQMIGIANCRLRPNTQNSRTLKPS